MKNFIGVLENVIKIDTKRMRNSSKCKCLTNSVEYDDKYLVVRILDLYALIRIWFCKIKALSKNIGPVHLGQF